MSIAGALAVGGMFGSAADAQTWLVPPFNPERAGWDQTAVGKCNDRNINHGLETVCITAVLVTADFGSPYELTDIQVKYTYTKPLRGGSPRRSVRLGFESASRKGAPGGDQKILANATDVQPGRRIDVAAPDYVAAEHPDFPCLRGVVYLDGQLRYSDPLCL